MERLRTVINASLIRNEERIGRVEEVLVEGQVGATPTG